MYKPFFLMCLSMVEYFRSSCVQDNCKTNCILLCVLFVMSLVDCLLFLFFFYVCLSQDFLFVLIHCCLVFILSPQPLAAAAAPAATPLPVAAPRLTASLLKLLGAGDPFALPTTVCSPCLVFDLIDIVNPYDF